ncbi:MAG: alpha/beta hydrolase [Pseudomonadales bacterium]|nr:alpha/beta hydrolase [Pseudomonadales bacterium]
MDNRRTFLGLGAATTAAIATSLPAAAAAAPKEAGVVSRVYDGIMGRGYARGPYGLVHFQDSGGLVKLRPGEWPLVLLHQSPASTRQFEAAFKPLVARGIRLIAVDTPGFGFSDPTPAIPKLEDWAPAIVAVLDHLGIQQADVLGHHTGALNATEVALQNPGRVRRLILNGPFPITEAERAQYIAAGERSHAAGVAVVDGSHLLNSFQTRVRMWGPNPDPAILTRTIAEKYQGLGPYWWGHYAAYRYDHAAALKRLTHPTLILTNTGDDIYELAQRARDLRPDFAYVEIPGGSHDIVDQQPDAWCDAVVAFLRRS